MGYRRPKLRCYKKMWKKSSSSLIFLLGIVGQSWHPSKDIMAAVPWNQVYMDSDVLNCHVTVHMVPLIKHNADLLIGKFPRTTDFHTWIETKLADLPFIHAPYMLLWGKLPKKGPPSQFDAMCNVCTSIILYLRVVPFLTSTKQHTLYRLTWPSSFQPPMPDLQLRILCRCPRSCS